LKKKKNEENLQKKLGVGKNGSELTVRGNLRKEENLELLHRSLGYVV